MDEIKKPLDLKACINCIYCRELNLFRRESSIYYDHSLCCTLFQEEENDISAPIYETSPNDFCEKFKCKHIIDKDESSMYDSVMIEMELKPSNHRYEEF